MINLGKLSSVPIERWSTTRPVSSTGRRPQYPCVGEPPLAELLSDPIVRRLMSSDSVTADDLSAVITAARARLTQEA
jgi:hypothetical protein